LAVTSVFPNCGFAFVTYRPDLIVSNGEHKTALSNIATAHCDQLSERSHPIHKLRKRS